MVSFSRALSPGRLFTSREGRPDGISRAYAVDPYRRGITISTGVVSCRAGDRTVTVIDTPRHAEFVAEVERACRRWCSSTSSTSPASIPPGARRTAGEAVPRDGAGRRGRP
ncbi:MULTISPECIES: GTP-binding protein [unclassified Amycolatopsis]|uniref:GTP-binding protein n=1 Tax=unclassified Amycolatopsis TaxID=2618356 RepID=UPI00287B9DBF|nr:MULTISPECIES: GTP-binding protein [unclassified Amycolatopsis]